MSELTLPLAGTVYTHIHPDEFVFNTRPCSPVVCDVRFYTNDKYDYAHVTVFWKNNKKQDYSMHFDMCFDTFLAHPEFKFEVDWILHDQKQGPAAVISRPDREHMTITSTLEIHPRSFQIHMTVPQAVRDWTSCRARHHKWPVA